MIMIIHVIPDIVEAMLPTFSSRNIGLIMTVERSFSHYSPDYNVNKKATFLFMRPSNYTKVFACSEDVNMYQLPDTTLRMQFYSDHDSCWSTEGTNLLNLQNSEIIGEIAEIDGIHCYNDLHIYESFSVFDGNPQYIEVKDIFCESGIDKYSRYKKDHLIEFGQKVPLCDIHHFIPKKDS
jgi:hypothetical protein